VDRETAVKLWEKAVGEGLWHVPWGKALEGLSASQAAWKPAPQRHSIWQIVNHILFWREYLLRELAGAPPDDAEIERRNWEEPADASEGAWRETATRFLRSHEEILKALRSNEEAPEKLAPLLAHDSYHVGQIMYLRALQGLPPLD